MIDRFSKNSLHLYIGGVVSVYHNVSLPSCFFYYASFATGRKEKVGFGAPAGDPLEAKFKYTLCSPSTRRDRRQWVGRVSNGFGTEDLADIDMVMERALENVRQARQAAKHHDSDHPAMCELEAILWPATTSCHSEPRRHWENRGRQLTEGLPVVCLRGSHNISWPTPPANVSFCTWFCESQCT